jgi:hypothetical protein
LSAFQATSLNNCFWVNTHFCVAIVVVVVCVCVCVCVCVLCRGVFVFLSHGLRTVAAAYTMRLCGCAAMPGRGRVDDKSRGAGLSVYVPACLPRRCGYFIFFSLWAEQITAGSMAGYTASCAAAFNISAWYLNQDHKSDK